MKEQFAQIQLKARESWNAIPPRTKKLGIITFLISLLLLSVVLFFLTRTSMTVLYNNLTPAEAGEVKAAIEQRGIQVEVAADGTSLSVPREQVNELKLALAAEGIPRNGSVNYSIFSENMGMGMTDRHFDVVERDAMQTEISTLIRQIDGVQDANVMITLPKESIWITEETKTASASVVLRSSPGFYLEQSQVNGLYHLISKSVPNLPAEEIVIMDQNGQVYEVQNEGQANTTLSIYQQQREVRKGIETDIQREIQQMLSMLMGQDKVIVSVTASVDFTTERREENLVQAPIEETNEGLDISVERIVESYTGESGLDEDATGTGEGEIPNFPGVDGAETSDSERTEERINREINRIQRQIEKNPYIIDDLTINVGIEPPIANDPTSLSPELVGEVRGIVSNVVAASLSLNEIPPEELNVDERVTVFATEFLGKQEVAVEENPLTLSRLLQNPYVFIVGGVLLFALVVVAFIVIARIRKRKEEEFFDEMEQEALVQLETKVAEELAVETRVNPKRDMIEKLATTQPEDFAKLLRAWMTDK
ncbi:flagellar M-ring protein FliF [Chryseomicrobium aureum]|uniref:flagellar basal-body MS-ring/collar protein FliF n=1 Tax=Chryseomicrobium aureum TaxID=1441723 RepID=UPI0019571E50|nr:flagellar basal-body MS-ring/collar protein FliF [Chryseomicrobium aureum]MBM7705980.1 flagellar M-ring protein FliF [Chryseomicrobium aureum]